MINKILGLLLLFLANGVIASDLDDGIALDTVINDDLVLDRNIAFIKSNAIGKARSRAKDRAGDIDDIEDIGEGCDGTGNIKIGPGTNLKGATIVNLSNNKGTTSVCAQ